jgi:hypothetical protein
VRQIASLILLFGFAIGGCSDEKELVCAGLGEKHVARMKADFAQDYTNIRTTDFYSPTFDSCIHTEVAVVGVDFEILDLSGGLLPNAPILHCDRDGADSVILDAVKRHGGSMNNVAYEEWLDDGFGGPPGTVKTPSQPYDRKQCERVFEKWLALLMSRTG